VAALTGPVAYTIDTVATPHTGSIITAGPVSSFGGGPQQGRGGFPGGAPGGAGQGGLRPQGSPPNGSFPQAGSAPGGRTGAGSGGFGGAIGGGREAGMGGGMGDRAGGGMGGLLDGTTVSAELKQLLTSNADSYTWVAATARAQNAASYQLATQQPVMAIGGFNGTTDSPTLQQFKADVAAGKVHYYISSGDGASGGGGPMAGTSSQDAASQIESWVQQNFTATTVGGVTVYDLTGGK
jgi:hypothetical protein